LIIPKGRKIYQHFPFQGPPKHTQIGIFGLKINHMATLMHKPEVTTCSLKHQSKTFLSTVQDICTYEQSFTCHFELMVNAIIQIWAYLPTP
jgi:hypothetical protein